MLAGGGRVQGRWVSSVGDGGRVPFFFFSFIVVVFVSFRLFFCGISVFVLFLIFEPENPRSCSVECGYAG